MLKVFDNWSSLLTIISTWLNFIDFLNKIFFELVWHTIGHQSIFIDCYAVV